VKKIMRGLADKGVLEMRGENKNRQYRIKKR
jgi:hypothetical protein